FTAFWNMEPRTRCSYGQFCQVRHRITSARTSTGQNKRHDHLHRGARAGSAPPQATSADLSEATLQVGKPIGIGSAARFVVETLAIVFNDEVKAIRLQSQTHPDFGRLGMLRDIVEDLLGGEIEVVPDRGFERRIGNGVGHIEPATKTGRTAVVLDEGSEKQNEVLECVVLR